MIMGRCVKYLSILSVVLLCLSFAKSSENSGQKNKLFLCEARGQEGLIIVTWKTNENEPSKCEYFKNRKQIDDIVSRYSEPDIERVNEKEFDEIIDDCDDLMNKKSEGERAEDNGKPMAAPGDSTEAPADDESSWNIIFPGTKWCGAGDIAKNYDDLGHHSETDKCCRAHDLCDDILKAGETRNNLTNSSPFTKLSCQCDNDFYDCLDRVDSMISNKIGNIYFNILRRDCYTWDYPLTRKCKTYRTFLKLTCKEYEKNTKSSKVYRWEKPKTYKKLPIPGPLTVTIPFL